MTINIRSTEQLPIQSWRDFPASNTHLEADVVIVGSGAGGSVMAFELAKIGLKVIVLEAGDFIPSAQFTEHLPSSMQRMYQDSGFQTNKRGDLSVLQGSCIGGSTVVNGAVCFRTPDAYLNKWVRDYGLSQLAPEKLSPYFDKIEKRLSVHENQAHESNAAGNALLHGAKKMGYSAKMLRRNTKDCALTGKCFSGCKVDRKQSMLVTYIPWAIDKGARFIANAKVEKVTSDNGVVRGVQAALTNSETGERHGTINVKAERVILSAGAVQTPLLVQKSGVLPGNKWVGKNFACHPSVIVVGEFEKTQNGWNGATISSYIDEFEYREKNAFILEAASAGPIFMNLSADGGLGKEYVEHMMKSKKFTLIGSLIHDKNIGSVYWDDDKKVIEYDLIDEDFETIKQSIKVMAEVNFAAGAKAVYLPTVRKNKVTSVEQVDSVLALLDNVPNQFYLTSYHPQGTMKMGVNPAESVVSPTGEVHGLENLFVADASLFPSSILVNPQLTVYALSNVIADGIIASI